MPRQSRLLTQGSAKPPIWRRIQGKSMLIRKTLKIRPMDPAWSLRSRMD